VKTLLLSRFQNGWDNNIQRPCARNAYIDKDAKGHQLRRHPTKWREISTMEATRLLLKDIHTDGEFEEGSEAMSEFQDILNAAARKQLGPPREKEVK